jgi:hypothetical protein
MQDASNEGMAQAIPSLVVLDWRENEIKLGSTVVYGSPENPDEVAYQTAKVTAISDPDTEFFEDDFGRDVARGIYVTITITFDDGKTETVKANYVTDNDGIEVYEESGDLQVMPETKG